LKNGAFDGRREIYQNHGAVLPCWVCSSLQVVLGKRTAPANFERGVNKGSRPPMLFDGWL
jgi:hypothetical protein